MSETTLAMAVFLVQMLIIVLLFKCGKQQEDFQRYAESNDDRNTRVWVRLYTIEKQQKEIKALRAQIAALSGAIVDLKLKDDSHD